MIYPASTKIADPRVVVRAIEEHELEKAEAIRALAFGTFIGVPDPENFNLDRNFIGTRWRANPESVLVAEYDGQLVATNVVTALGSVGFLGPLTIHPSFWDRGIAQQLLAPSMELLEKLGVTHGGLYTFSNSAKHMHLYQKFGFWPRFLTAVLSKAIPAGGGAEASESSEFFNLSELSNDEQEAIIGDLAGLCGEILDGLDVTGEIRSVTSQKLGEVVVIHGSDRADGFAVCHCGEGTEAGKDACYIKFAAVRPGGKGSAQAGENFTRLLGACETMAAARGLKRMEAGVNLARVEAYRGLVKTGYRTLFQGVAMHVGNDEGYNRPGVYIIDDWR